VSKAYTGLLVDLILIFKSPDPHWFERAVSMIVCHCHYVSDREIRQCMQAGACDVADVGRACGAGTGCGGCRPEIENIVGSAEGTSVRVRANLLPVLQEAG
jgi:bacterioferritin-associated ferredoxin